MPEAPAAPVVYRPNAGPQMAFLSCGAWEVGFGGAASGGKTFGLIIDAIRKAMVPGYRALLLRRTVAELKKPSGLLERCWQLLPGIGGEPREGGYTWFWPGGGRLDIAGMEHPQDRFNYAGTELQWIGFDEATSFTGPMFLYMLARLRAAPGIPTRVRWASNPGGEGHDFFLDRYAPWLRREDPDYDGPRASTGERLYFRHEPARDAYIQCSRTEPGARSRTFFPSRFTDTPQIDQGEYAANLDALDRLTRLQLKEGNWLVRPSAGLLFKSEWFSRARGTIVDAAPHYAKFRCRAWDFAGTPLKEGREGTSPGQAATAGVRMSLGLDDCIYIEHAEEIFATPGQVRDAVCDHADADDRHFKQPVFVSYPVDPGQAGIDQKRQYEAALLGRWHHGTPERGSKIDRAKPFSSACEHGRVKIVQGPWTTTYIRRLEDFPFGLKDLVDASSRGYAECLRAPSLIKPRDRSKPPTRETARARGDY